MIVERYSVKYNDDIVRLTDAFYNESLKEYMRLDYKTILDTIDELRHSAFLLVMDDKAVGMLAGKEVTTPLSKDKYWHEVVWYVDKLYRKYGVWMLKQVTQLLKQDGYVGMVMVCMHNSMTDKLSKFYTRQGFQAMETHFIKAI